MKYQIAILLSLFAVSSFAQDKVWVSYNKLTELKGTNYVIAREDRDSKMSVRSRNLLFINTANGEVHKVELPPKAYITEITQVKNDTVGVNKVVVIAKTVNLDGNRRGIDWNDPEQVLIFSPDGKQQEQITDDRFFVGDWLFNNKTGAITIIGHYDTNENGKQDRYDKHEVIVYDLVRMKLLSRI